MLAACALQCGPLEPNRSVWRQPLARDISLWVIGLLGSLACCSDSARDLDASEHDAGALQPSEAQRLPRNLIVFMGDGMGAEQVAAGRFAAGGRLAMDALNGPALAVTDSLTTLRIGGDFPPATDSAAAATWIATGVRVENDVISISPDETKLETVLELYKRSGKATGLVTTAAFFDASPAAFASHQLSRSFFPEIVREMLTTAQPEIIMGAGGWLFDDPQYNLTEAATLGGYAVIRDAAALADFGASSTERLLAMFATDFLPSFLAPDPFTMTPAIERTENTADPSLLTMTQHALRQLGENPQGFFLFAEDEITDQIGHSAPGDVAWAKRALPAQVVALDAAVSYAIEWTLEHSSFDETLIVVLADHETGGYRFDHTLGPESGEFRGRDAIGGFHTRAPTEVRALGPGSQAVEQIASHGDTYQLLVGTLAPTR